MRSFLSVAALVLTVQSRVADAEAPNASSPSFRVHLADGSVPIGVIARDHVQVATDFGTLEVPLSRIVSVVPGLNSRPEERRKITGLFDALASPAAADRERAQKTLAGYGPPIRSLCEAYANDTDAERRLRIRQLLDEFSEADFDDDGDPHSGEPMVDDDRVVTDSFTIRGRLLLRGCELATEYGDLRLELSRILRLERVDHIPPPKRRTVTLSGVHLAPIAFRSTRLRVERGDRVTVFATGRILLTPWGNDKYTNPDGVESLPQYGSNEIKAGALCGRIGAAGDVFPIGRSHSFTASRAGMLSLAIAVSPEFVGQGYTFPGEYVARIQVESGRSMHPSGHADTKGIAGVSARND